MRTDVYEKWGWPCCDWDQSKRRSHLRDILISDSRRDSLWLNEVEHPVTWTEIDPGGSEVDESVQQGAGPVVVAKA